MFPVPGFFMAQQPGDHLVLTGYRANRVIAIGDLPARAVPLVQDRKQRGGVHEEHDGASADRGHPHGGTASVELLRERNQRVLENGFLAGLARQRPQHPRCHGSQHLAGSRLAFGDQLLPPFPCTAREQEHPCGNAGLSRGDLADQARQGFGLVDDQQHRFGTVADRVGGQLLTARLDPVAIAAVLLPGLGGQLQCQTGLAAARLASDQLHPSQSW